MEICGILGLPIPIVPRLHQSNSYVNRKLRAWRVQKCIPLVGADTVLTSAGPQIPRFMGDSIGPRMEICGTSAYQSHGTAFASKQWLYEKEATDMESSKRFYPSRC